MAILPLNYSNSNFPLKAELELTFPNLKSKI
jgi:hypothetical protein